MRISPVIPRRSPARRAIMAVDLPKDKALFVLDRLLIRSPFPGLEDQALDVLDVFSAGGLSAGARLCPQLRQAQQHRRTSLPSCG